jgi:hypothetical protein
MSARVSKLQRDILWRIAQMEYSNKKYQQTGISPLSAVSYVELPALRRLVDRKILVENAKGRINLAAEHRGTYMVEAITEWKTLRSCAHPLKVAYLAIQESSRTLSRSVDPLVIAGNQWTNTRATIRTETLPVLRTQLAALTAAINNVENALNNVVVPTADEVKVDLVTRELEVT